MACSMLLLLLLLPAPAAGQACNAGDVVTASAESCASFCAETVAQFSGYIAVPAIYQGAQHGAAHGEAPCSRRL